MTDVPECSSQAGLGHPRRATAQLPKRQRGARTATSGQGPHQLGPGRALVLFLLLASPATPAGAVPELPVRAELGSRLGDLRVPFVANEGQLDPTVRFSAHTFAGTVFVTARGEIVYALPGQPGDRDASRREAREATPSWTIVERFPGSTPEVRGQAEASTRVSSFVGSDPGRWRSELKTWDSINLGELWPGVEITLEARGRNIEKVYRVAPQHDPELIWMEVSGASTLSLSTKGELVIETGLGNVTLSKPVAFEEHEGGRVEVPVAYRLQGMRYGFTVGPRDPRHALVIDPLLQATYLGGASDEQLHDIVVTGSEVFVAGATMGSDFPGTAGGYQGTTGGNWDGYVARLNLALTSLSQATYLGGAQDDFINALAVTENEVLVAGETFSSNFPGTTRGAQENLAGIGDGFVARLDRSLTSLAQATYLGGAHTVYSEIIRDLVVTEFYVFVGGLTRSADFPGTALGAQPNLSGTGDGFLARFDSSLTSLLGATYLGGSDMTTYDEVTAIAVTGTTVLAVGHTPSGDFPGTVGGAQSSTGGGQDVFVARLDELLEVLWQSSYLGGQGNDYGSALAVTGEDVYLSGYTSSSDFPGTAGGAQASFGGAEDGFVARLSSSLTSLVQTTYLGGSGVDDGMALALGGLAAPEVLVLGDTSSTDLPGTTGALQPALNGATDAFVVRLNPALTTLVQTTYLGGADGETGHAAAVAGSDLYVAGVTTSDGFPGSTGGYQASRAGEKEAFVAWLTQDLSGPTPTPTATPADTATSTPTDTPTFTPTATHTATTTPTFTATPTATRSPTATATHTPTFTPTATHTATATPTFTATPTATRSPTATATHTATHTPTHTPTATHTVAATPTFTATPTATRSPTVTATHTPTETATHTFTATPTATATPTPTSTTTPSWTPTSTPTSTGTPTPVPADAIPLPDADELVARPADSAVWLTFFAGQTAVPDLSTGVSWMIRRAVDRHPRTPAEGTWVVTDPQLPYLDAGLANDLTYYYALFAVPQVGQSGSPMYGPSLGTFAEAMPRSSTAGAEAIHFLSGPTVEALAPSSLLVSWAVNEPSSAEVITELGETLFADAAFATRRSVLVDLSAPPLGETVSVCVQPATARDASCSDPITIPPVPGGDTVRPVFYEAPSVIEVGSDRIVIRIIADEPVLVEVSLRPERSDGRRLARRLFLSREHLVEVTGLGPGVTYLFSVVATDHAGNQAVSGERRVTTCVGCAPSIGSTASVFCDSRTAGAAGAVIILESPLLVRATLQWGSSGGALGGVADLATLLRRQTLFLPGSTTGVDIEYRVTFHDRMGNAAPVITGACQTAAAAPIGDLRITAGPFADYRRLGTNQVIISWTTDFAATGSIVSLTEVGSDAELGPAVSPPRITRTLTPSAEVGPLGLEHEIALTNLSANTRYSVVVRSVDLYNRAVESEALIFSTLEAGHTMPPALIGAAIVVLSAMDRIVVDWQTNRDTTGALELRSAEASYVWMCAAAGTSHRAVFTGVIPGIYTAVVYSRTFDGYDLASESPDLDVNPPAEPDTAPPQIADVAVVPLSDGMALLRWRTSEPAKSIVTYGTSLPLRLRIEDHALVTSHLVLLTGLESGKKILYQIGASDVAGNGQSFGPGQVQLPPEKDVTPPQIEAASVRFRWEDGQTAVVEWDTDEPASSIVEYGGGMQYALLAQDGQHTEHHEITLAGFFPGKPYYARLLSIDAEGNKSNRHELEPFMAPVPVASPVVAATLAVLLLGVASTRIGSRRRRESSGSDAARR